MSRLARKVRRGEIGVGAAMTPRFLEFMLGLAIGITTAIPRTSRRASPLENLGT
jgi:hypothetical protein